MNAQKYFEQHAEELIASYAGKNVVLFFRGFVPANVRWLAPSRRCGFAGRQGF